MSQLKRGKLNRRSAAAFAGLACGVFALCAVLFGIGALPVPGEDSPSAGSPSAVSLDAAEARDAQGTSADSDAASNEPSESNADGVDAADAATEDGVSFAPGEVFVKLMDGMDAAGLASRLQQLDYVAEQSISNEDVSLGWTTVKLADGQDVKTAAARLMEDGIVDTAQPNYIYHLADATETADPLQAAATSLESAPEGVISLQEAYTLVDYDNKYMAANKLPVWDYTSANWTNYSNIGYQYAKQQWWYAAAYGDAAYLDIAGGKYTLDQSKRPSVAIIDSGALLTHEDLVDNVVDWYDVTTSSKPSKESFQDSMSATTWHGTHVAGIISAIAGNTAGIAGISDNAGIVPLRVTNGSGEVSTATLKKAYDYVLEHAQESNIRVVNLSLEIDMRILEEDTGKVKVVGEREPDTAMLETIDKASAKGILTVAAAGNGVLYWYGPNDDNYDYLGPYKSFPTYYAETSMGVIGSWLLPVQRSETEGDFFPPSRAFLGRVYYSNHNTESKIKVDQVAAPANKIASTVGPPEGYALMSGTSMAAPVVSGTAALLLWANPKLEPDEVKSVLYSTAQDINYGKFKNLSRYNEDLFDDVTTEGFDQYTGFGHIDAATALERSGNYLSGKTSTVVGGSVQLTPKVNNAASTSEWTWSVDDTSIATVDATGKVTGVSGGAVAVAATTGEGNDAITLRQIVNIHQAVINGDATAAIGAKKTYTVKDSPLENGRWTWSVSDTSKATITSGGVVTVKAPGAFNVIATLTTNPQASITKTVTVNSYPLTGISLSASAFTYNGKSQRPGVTVRCAAGVVPASGYTLSFSPTDTTNVGTKTVIATGKGAYTGTVRATYKINPTPTRAMYRLYNPNSGEHFYTADAGERNFLAKIGWKAEGVGWWAPTSSSAPVYRLYNPNSGDHHYTLSKSESDFLRSIGWRYEGVGWYSDQFKRRPLYREFNPNVEIGSHNYTTSASEHRFLVSIGWRNEGIAWYGVS